MQNRENAGSKEVRFFNIEKENDEYSIKVGNLYFKDFKAQINDDDSTKADVIVNAVTTVKYHGIMGSTDNVSTQGPSSR